MRQGSEIVAIFKDAFRPLRCDAETYYDDQRLRFRVLDPSGKSLFRPSYLKLADIRSDIWLSGILLELRRQVERTGNTLDPWTPPGS